MKSPLWIINSILVLFLVIIFGYIVFSAKEIPTPISLRSTAMQTTEETGKKLDQGFLRVIYEDNDLFGTYIPKKIEEEKIQEVIAPPPQPPRPKPSMPLPVPAVSFMEPLKVSVTGIIMSTNEADNQIIIADNATKQEKLYRVGDKILDAHILRIFSNKVIFIRANGQQETLYVNAQEAQAEIKQLEEIAWDTIIKKRGDNHFTIDPKAVTAYISSLAQFIDLLDLTTVFSKGVSIGIRIGKIDRKSVGAALGLIPGDIITSISGIAPTNTNARVEIYNKIRASKEGSKITVGISRGRLKTEIHYELEAIKAESKPKLTPETSQASSPLVAPEDITEEKAKLMKEKYKFGSTVQDFKKRDRLAMTQHGSKKAILRKHPQTS